MDEEPPRTYDICEICFWEDDGHQFEHQDEDGANNVSFREAKQNFIEFGVSGKDFLKHIIPSNKGDIKDPNWKPLE